MVCIRVVGRVFIGALILPPGLLLLFLALLVELITEPLPVVVELLAVGCVVVDGLLFAVGGAVVGAVLVLDGGLAWLSGLAGLRRGAVVDGDAVVLIQRRLSSAGVIGGHGGYGGWDEFGSASGWPGWGATVAGSAAAVWWAVGARDREHGVGA
ncbi:hypothetical protein BKG75_11125 [Mycobacteroides chelonae]|nr:hypothetical protein BKG75_11125 [Mycobacteroides chelonae]